MQTAPNHPHWADTAIPKLPRLCQDLTVDVAVVGAGFTGLITAHILKQAGLRVALLERDAVASCDTGHTTAHLTYVTDSRLTDLVSTFGAETARSVWNAGEQAIELIEQISLGAESLCDFVRVPGFLHVRPGATEGEAELRKELSAAETLGFRATWTSETPVFGTPGIRFDGNAKFHPVLFLAALVNRISGDGCHVFEHSPVSEFAEKPRRVKVNGYSVHCDNVVIATHVPLTGNTNIAAATILQSKLALYTSYVSPGNKNGKSRVTLR